MFVSERTNASAEISDLNQNINPISWIDTTTKKTTYT